MEIKDVQAIKYLRAELPEEGGIVVATGSHGEGKTTSINCASALLNQEVRSSLQPRDGCTCGTIEAPGVTVRISRRNTVSGELALSMLDSECDVSKLVDPKLKDPVLADARRLRILVGVGHVQVTAEQWGCHLIDVLDHKEVTAAVAGIRPDAPVEAAEVIRTRVNELALAKEKAAVAASEKANALFEQVAGIDLTAPSDAATLQREYELALGAFSRLTAEASAAADQREAVESARAQLAQVESSLPDLDSIRLEIKVAEDDRRDRQREIAEIDQQIRELQSKRGELVRIVDRATAASKAASDRLAAASRQHNGVAALRKIVDAGAPAGPPTEAIETARQAKDKASQAIVSGEQVRNANRVHFDATESRKRAEIAEGYGKQLRALAHSTDVVLEEALREAGFVGLQCRDGRLYVESNRGREGVWELFDELSEGERYQWGLKWLSQKLPAGTLIPLSQEAWQGQSDQARQDIASLFRAHKLWGWTGQIASGELRAEVYRGAVEYPVGAE